MTAWLERVGRPISYGLPAHRVRRCRPTRPCSPAEPGSAEMPSAGRPFTARVLADLAHRGVTVTEVTLHTGVSSTRGRRAAAARVVPGPPRHRTHGEHDPRRRRAGDRGRHDRRPRAGERGRPARPVAPAAGWTELVLGPDRAPRVVDGLITGWHEPEASHLLLLEAVAGAELVGRAYAAALAARYRWHEFGDSCLLLPESQRAQACRPACPPSASAQR